MPRRTSDSPIEYRNYPIDSSYREIQINITTVNASANCESTVGIRAEASSDGPRTLSIASDTGRNEGAIMARYTAKLRVPADVGLAIQQARMARGLSQTDLAAQTSLHQSAISEVESGKSTIHLRRILELALATGLEITASWDVDDQDEHAPRG